MVASINKWTILQYKTSQKYIICQKRFFRENDGSHYRKDEFCQKLCYHNSYFQHRLHEKVGETLRCNDPQGMHLRHEIKRIKLNKQTLLKTPR